MDSKNRSKGSANSTKSTEGYAKRSVLDAGDAIHVANECSSISFRFRDFVCSCRSDSVGVAQCGSGFLTYILLV